MPEVTMTQFYRDDFFLNQTVLLLLKKLTFLHTSSEIYVVEKRASGNLNFKDEWRIADDFTDGSEDKAGSRCAHSASHSTDT